MIEVHLPRLFPTMSEFDSLTIEQWYVKEGDMVKAGDYLVEVEAPPGLITIPTPPNVTTPCRVQRIHKAPGSSVRLGELLTSLDPASEH
jgi:pyruvate/2-oxoglutarate dehydrogenase complex dihydrolipoamide acyltransferase (E2) component